LLNPPLLEGLNGFEENDMICTNFRIRAVKFELLFRFA
jgi:hypothetical protein